MGQKTVLQTAASKAAGVASSVVAHKTGSVHSTSTAAPTQAGTAKSDASDLAAPFISVSVALLVMQ